MYFILQGVFATDIITNSSSVVYSIASGPSTLHGMINEIFRLADVDKKSEDVFDIIVLPHKHRLRGAPEFISNFFELANMDGEGYPWTWNDPRLDEVESAAIRLVAERKLTADDFTNDDGWEPDYYNSNYVVSLKDGTETSVGKLVAGLFSHEGSYDG